MFNLLAIIGRDTQLKRTCSKNGGEYSGPCPLCRRGVDRFKVWPRLERWACLGPKAGRSGCDRGGDAIQYLIERDGMTYRQACDRLNVTVNVESLRGNAQAASHERAGKFLSHSQFPRLCIEPLSPPSPIWQAHANAWAARCAVMLWRPEGARARDYLHSRGLCDEVLRLFGVGYNPRDVYEDHAQWGLSKPEGGSRCVWLPRGITFPWYVGGATWRLNVRRPLTPSQARDGQPKYIGPSGFSNALYNADALSLSTPGTSASAKPAVLVEGEIDALTIAQAYANQSAAAMAVAVVATGSTAGARHSHWVAKLALAPVVLLAFDVDSNGAGDKAAAWWQNVLPNARRWRPVLHDVNSLPAPKDVRDWIERGLNQFA